MILAGLLSALIVLAAPRALPPSTTPVSVPASPDPQALLARLQATAGESVLLVGLHTELIEGYQPMFDADGKPRTQVAPGYRTLVFHVKAGQVTLESQLPYIALPLATGFVYLGEASVSLHGPARPTEDSGEPQQEPPDEYDATSLWLARSRTEVPSISARLQRKLRRAREPGVEDTEQLVYATPHALCRHRTMTQWTGGALWFTGSTELHLTTPLGAPLSRPLARIASDAELQAFMSLALTEYEGQDATLDQPFDAGWGHLIDFRKDPSTCLEHRQGRVWAHGSVVLPGNSARSYAFSSPVKPAPASLAGANPALLDFDEVVRAWPAALDFVASYHRDALLLQTARGFVAIDALTGREGRTFPIPGRIVMVESATGVAVSRWRSELRHQ
jgi:hypothetical protein